MADQAAASATGFGVESGYIEDASFWKFREVSLQLLVPSHWAARIGASRLVLTFAARNLATWTHYRGLDPELAETAEDTLTREDLFIEPAQRYFLTHLDIGW